ncbi:hypothetical protein [Anaerospora hongkongensis]|uniref:hypothetical protein n=1 Tax=Anaerospora hongkongensis TaxID=244830 RepID=UPI00289E64C3|nr:hypothetical protein [Anaerospora hongkongensis]
MKLEDERTKLFNEIWNEPMTTVSQRYGLSDNGLRKRCLSLDIPVPPRGYWAKIKAGLQVPAKPTLPTLKVKKQAFVLKDKKQEREIEFIDISSQSTEVLKTLAGMDVLQQQSQEDFTNWCRRIQVPKKVDLYHPLIIEYQEEIEYRKARDKEHKFHDHFRYTDISFKSKVKYRENTPVLPILVSDKQLQRAFRIIDTLIKAVENLEGKVTVDKSSYRPKEAKDNVSITVFQSLVSFQVTEIMSKRRDVMANMSEEKKIREFRPLYEKIFTGMLEIELKQISSSWEKDKTQRLFILKDSTELPLESQIGEMVQFMFKAAQEAKLDRIIREREVEEKRKECEHRREIEQEEQRKLQAQIAQEKRQKQLVANIEQQMDDWFKAQRLRQYAEALEEYAIAISDEVTKERLSAYIVLVRQKAEGCDPVDVILNEIRSIESTL